MKYLSFYQKRFLSLPTIPPIILTTGTFIWGDVARKHADIARNNLKIHKL